MKLHEDKRRTLIDWSDDMSIETCKIVEAKEDCVLGNHYHKEKTERFMLLKGSADIFRYQVVNGVQVTNYGDRGPMTLNKPYIVRPGVRHSFWLLRGAILICLVDHKYNPNDDFED